MSRWRAHGARTLPLKSRAATLLRLMAPIRFATAKTVVAGAVAGGILFGSQLVMAAAPTADFDFTPGVGPRRASR